MKKIIITILTIILVVILGAGGYYLAILFEQNYQEQQEITQISEQFELKQIEDSLNVTPTQTPAPTPTPTTTPTPTAAPTVIITPKPTNIEPENNQAPEIRFLSGGMPDKINKDYPPLSISYRASDKDGYISKVEIYVNGNLDKTITNLAYGGKDEDDGFDIDKQFDITKESGDYVEKKTGDKVDYYIGRYHRNWEQNDPLEANCDIKKGYINYHIGEKNYYITKSTSDGSKHQICYSEDTVNIDDLYYYLFTDVKDGSYKVYALAYDNYQRTTKSETYEFKVD